MNRIGAYQGSMELRECSGVGILKFPKWEEIKGIEHGFSTRIGGVSTGIYSSLNFKDDAQDLKENVVENYKRLAQAQAVDVNKMVRSVQTHTSKVYVVREEDLGYGVMRENKIVEHDALITNLADVTLICTYADCVPIYLVDTVHRAIGLVHSGWKGTVEEISSQTLLRMQEEYQTNPRDVVAAIGPCICDTCYEVDAALYDAFSAKFDGVLKAKEELGKYELDLRKANLQILLRSGLREEQITISDICTCCNPDLVFSHRYTKGKRGVAVASLCLVSEKSK